MSTISRNFTSGDTCTISATPSTGYSFTGWYENDSLASNANPYSFTVNANRSLVGRFSANAYVVSATVDPKDAGTVSGTGSYDYGTTATLTATPAAGYNFVNWTVGGSVVGSNPTYSFTVSGDATVQANFVIKTYNIAAVIDPVGGGTVSGTGTYNHGQSVSLTATPSAGYTFVGWYTGASSKISTDNPLTFIATESITYTAKFAPTYTISVEYDNAKGTAAFVEQQQENE